MRWLLLALSLALPAQARVLAVGPGQEFDSPSRAVRAAAAHDTVLIEPGTYYDCAVATVPLTIEGHGPGVVLTDKTCEDKAILVLRGGTMVVRNLTLARARVGDGNGAGIRMEGDGLLAEHVVFDNDEVGILSGGMGPVQVRDCTFQGGGVGGERPLAALFVGPAAALTVERSRFAAIRGAQVISGAVLTTISGSIFDTGAEARGLDVHGALLMQGNTLTAGPAAAAGMVRVDGPGPVTLRQNRFIGRVMLQDWTGGTPVLENNELSPGAEAVSTEGVWRHRASAALHGAKDGARALAGQVKHGVLGR